MSVMSSSTSRRSISSPASNRVMPSIARTTGAGGCVSTASGCRRSTARRVAAVVTPGSQIPVIPPSPHDTAHAPSAVSKTANASVPMTAPYAAATTKSARQELLRVVHHDDAGDDVVQRLPLLARHHQDEGDDQGDEAEDALGNPADDLTQCH